MEEKRELREHHEAAPGLCECGCGKRTTIVRAGPRRYVHGHSGRKRERYVKTATGYTTDCWIWLLSKRPDGYGQVGVEPHKPRPAHRVYYEEKYGPVPEGLQLDHLCRVRACVNPDHLEPVTAAENVRRGRRTKLTVARVEAIRSSSEKQSVIAARFGIDQSHVSRIRSGDCWRA